MRIKKGDSVRLVTCETVGTVVSSRGRVVEIQWPGAKETRARIHRRDFVEKVPKQERTKARGGS